MVAGAINCEKDLSQHPEWQDQYQPKHDVQHNIYNDLMKYPTLDEWIDNVRSLIIKLPVLLRNVEKFE
ncbi:hypothetical protein RclHR1_10880004 [Rhizophagus clarus]|uniref:Uncharacterized protein n=1 Tax=Rhizophagus clarus TaxID=94130 RepID=A0A2Z6QEV8_9GLOM|nr:hypothetical protein RclHR1_10880004 [Rhizophagus clarus]